MRGISRWFAVLATVAAASAALAQSPSILWSKRVSRSAINAVQYSPTGEILATASDDGKVRLYRASDGRLLGTVASHYGSALSLAFSPDGAYLATGGGDNAIHMVRMSGFGTVYALATTGIVEGLAFTPDGQTLGAALGYFSRDLRQFRAWDGEMIAITQHHWGTVWSVDYSRDGRHVVTAGADGRVLLYGVPMWNPIDLASHEGDAIAAKFSPDSQLVASAGEYEARLNVSDVATGVLRYSIDVGTIMHAIAFTPSGLIGVAGRTWPDGNGRIAFYRLSDGGQALVFTNQTAQFVNGLSVSPDGSTFAYGRNDGVLVVANLTPSLGSGK
jgi:WD40 repeat protein